MTDQQLLDELGSASIKAHVRNVKLGIEASQPWDIRLGQYNEFYLPSIGRDHEMWIVITDGNGNETRLHLKQ